VVSDRAQARPARAAVDPDLQVAIENHPPRSLPVGQGTAIFCFGHCFHRHRAVGGLELVVDGARHRPAASRMPRRDLYEWLHGSKGEDPEGRSYRSGFWATIGVPAQARPGSLELQAAVRMGDAEQLVRLARIDVVEDERRSWRGGSLHPGTIAICMATFEPDIGLFRAQIDSLREQHDQHWICVLSDDGSAEHHFAQMLEVLGDDPRFEVSRAAKRVGPYRNFERALEMVPADIQLVAPCDQDDRWYPEKLEVLRSALGDAQLVYSDQRLVSSDGRVIRETMWQGRRNDYRNLASLLVANTIAGAGMLFRRQVAELSLPFPNAPGFDYHDHWLALVALASGEIAYVDRPLYDYVQHAGAVSGDLVERERPLSLAGSRGLRSAYFAGYLGREVQAQALLLRCHDTLTRRKRRALERFISSARSPIGFLWLAVRPLRRLVGRGETLGGELALVRGILWRWLLAVAVGWAKLPGNRPYDASFPDPPRFEQPRLRRWRAGL
jgi:glycosyltransferase involved in cell wall biosynthesis